MMQEKNLVDVKMEKALYPVFGNLSEIIVAVNKKKIQVEKISEDEYAEILKRQVIEFIKKFAGEDMAKRTEEELLKNFKIRGGN